jgi:hypothetical protein
MSQIMSAQDDFGQCAVFSPRFTHLVLTTLTLYPPPLWKKPSGKKHASGNLWKYMFPVLYEVGADV